MTQPPAQPKFDPAADHHRRPKVRPLRGMPLSGQTPDGKTVQMLGLADARQISDKMVAVVPAVQVVLPLLDGTRGIDEIVTQVGRGLNREFLEHLVAQLDDAALLEGPTYQALLRKTQEEFDASENLPPATTAAFADALVNQALDQEATDEQKAAEGPRRLREAFDQWINQALEKADPKQLPALPRAIMAPHLDYPRGWMNYAAVWGRLRGTDRPDRVVILGTNHHGLGTGVVGCDKGFETPLGTCPVDADLVASLRASLGDRLFACRVDHEREHSVELQIPWIQHIFGQDAGGAYPKVFGALVHDPAVANGESYDGQGVSLEAFVAALRKAIDALPGKTLIVSSADLSHCGPAFGDQQPLAGDQPEPTQARNKIVQHDLQMLELVSKNQPADLIAAMAWQQNPTRWCSTGNIVATLMLTQPSQVQLLNYAAAMDSQGATFVSSAAMALS